MKFLEWTNTAFGDYDIFGIFTERETEKMSEILGDRVMIAADWNGERFFWLNSKTKVIQPMELLSYAFGGQYDGYPPYGKKLSEFRFDATEYTLI